MQISSVTLMDKVRGDRPTCAILIDAEIYWPLTEYFRERNFSIESERAYAHAVSRFMAWVGSKKKEGTFTKDDFNAFLHDLAAGTETQPSGGLGLWWKPSSSQTVSLIASRVAEFSDWLSSAHGTVAVNPKSRSSSYTESIRSLKSFLSKKRASMMGHAKSAAKAANQSELTREVATPGRKLNLAKSVAAFPEERINDLLWKGFARSGVSELASPWERWNLRDILITLLCLYGGLRESEPMHLWVSDVFEDTSDPESCRVLVHHPEEGMIECGKTAEGKDKLLRRKEYLSKHCSGRKPLTQETGRRHAGWKGCLLTERKRKAFHVFWINPEAGRLFKAIWSVYLSHARSHTPGVPWAFLGKDGLPLGSQAFSDSFKAAVERIGLKASKWEGTTPHGLRHRYGQWLNDLNISTKHGQICMHHANPLSQEVYREAGAEEVQKALADAARMNGAFPLIMPSDFLKRIEGK